MKDIFFAPFLSLFSVSFYRRLNAAPALAKGFGYLVYLSALIGVLGMAGLGFFLNRYAGEYMQWFKQNMPPVTFTQEGAVCEAEQPFTLKHPQYGTILVVDTAREDAPAVSEMPDTPVFLTKTKLVARQRSRGQYRVFDIVPKGDGLRNWKDFTLDGAFTEGFYNRAVPILYPAIFLICSIFYFIWKLLAAVVYSLIALGLNLFRKEKLPYESLLALSMFALTPVAMLQIFAAIIPAMRITTNAGLSIIITSCYLALGIFFTQPQAQDQTPV